MDTTSIKISPILTSRKAAFSAPNDMPLPSPINTNTNVKSSISINGATHRTPLQQQPPVETTRCRSPLQRDKDFYYGYHDRRNLQNSSCSRKNTSRYNDENSNGVNRFANFRRTLMEDDGNNNCDTSGSLDVPHPVHSDRTFVYDIDAPSDEREEDEALCEIMSIVEHQEYEYEQDRDSRENNNVENEQDYQNNAEEEETDVERMQREEEESLALARQLMAEEAMASYAESSNFLRSHANEYSEEDLRALEALMAEEDPMVDEAEEIGDDNGSLELSYDALLQLGERIGDVKSERWALKAKEEIAKLETIPFNCQMTTNKDENDSCVKCLICQFHYQEGERLRVLPCKHRFHNDCVDQWLMTKDHCPYCRQCITK